MKKMAILLVLTLLVLLCTCGEDVISYDINITWVDSTDFTSDSDVYAAIWDGFPADKSEEEAAYYEKLTAGTNTRIKIDLEEDLALAIVFWDDNSNGKYDDDESITGSVGLAGDKKEGKGLATFEIEAYY